MGGLNGADESTGIAIELAGAGHPGVRLIAIPEANPDKSKLQFPPNGVAYRDNP